MFYKQGISETFEIDLNDPYETGEGTNNGSIDDVIARARACARNERNKQKIYNAFGEDYSMKLAEENDQLADWLEELKEYRAKCKPRCLGNSYDCGLCHAWIGYYNDNNYCWNCGKKIDWENVKK